MVDDFLALTPVDPISIAFPGRQALSVAQDAGLTAPDVRNGLNQTAVRVTALENAPSPSGNYDVTVTTALVAGDVGKVVQNSGSDPFTDGSGAEVYDTTKTPVGVLVSVDGLGGGIVRRWGVGPCITALNSDVGLVEAQTAGRVVSAGVDSAVVVGRILTNTGMDQPSTMFVTAIATVGLTTPSV